MVLICTFEGPQKNKKMDLSSFMKSYAEEINGNFSEYDANRYVIIVPLKMERQQAVVAELNAQSDIITITSKVCVANDSIKFKELLNENHRTTYGKFTIANDFLNVEYKSPTNSTNENNLKVAIQEIANLADRWELNITGKDIF